jgi:murein endopeptidase
MGPRSPSPRPGARLRLAVAPALLLVMLAGAGACADRDTGPAAATPAPAAPTPAAPTSQRPATRPSAPRPRPAPIRWRMSRALGSPSAGRLERGVQLPARRGRFLTWDPVLRRSPNRPWRRWGTDRVVRTLLDVAREFGATHPDAPRVLIGDLSRPHGGDFGVRFGPIGHASHQNGLDADVYYPREDERERAPKDATEIDRRLSQALVDLFVAHGAQVVFVGPGTGLTGPPGRVQTLANHDNHLHVRLP